MTTTTWTTRTTMSTAMLTIAFRCAVCSRFSRSTKYSNRISPRDWLLSGASRNSCSCSDKRMYGATAEDRRRHYHSDTNHACDDPTMHKTWQNKAYALESVRRRGSGVVVDRREQQEKPSFQFVRSVMMLCAEHNVMYTICPINLIRVSRLAPSKYISACVNVVLDWTHMHASTWMDGQ